MEALFDDAGLYPFPNEAVFVPEVLGNLEQFWRREDDLPPLLKIGLVRDTGDWESRLAFFPRGVAAVSIEAAATARRILHLRPYSAPARETPYRGHRAFRARRRIPAFAEMTSE